MADERAMKQLVQIVADGVRRSQPEGDIIARLVLEGVVHVGLDMIIRQNDPSAAELTRAIQSGSLESLQRLLAVPNKHPWRLPRASIPDARRWSAGCVRKAPGNVAESGAAPGRGAVLTPGFCPLSHAAGERVFDDSGFGLGKQTFRPRCPSTW
jgi:hypothetical protein